MRSGHIPDKLLLHRRAPASSTAGTGTGAGRTVMSAAGAGATKKQPTFVTSPPVAYLLLERVTAALRDEFDARFGPRRHGLDGRGWTGGTAAHAAVLHSKMPWILLQDEGAGDLLDTEFHTENPTVEVGTAGRGSHQVRAVATAYVAAVSRWLYAGQRVLMGARADGDPTPPDTAAPALFPTQHAMLLKTRPRLWDVPPPYRQRVSRVVVRLEDAECPTRFWVLAPVTSAALRPASAEWDAFVSGLVPAAVAAEPVDERVDTVLCPIVPTLTVKSRVHGVTGLQHAGHPSLPPAQIIDAQVSLFLRVDEAGDEPFDAVPDLLEHEDVDADDDDDDHEDGEEKDAAAAADEAEDGQGRATAFAFPPDADWLVAVCDTRLALPLVVAVVENVKLRELKFELPADDAAFAVDWHLLHDRYRWMSWAVDM